MRPILPSVAVVTLVALGACSPEPPVYGAESATDADVAGGGVAAAAGELSRSEAAPPDEVRIEQAPPPPTSLHEFLSRDDRAATRLRRADFARLFPREAHVGTEPTASFEFADLDGDGRDEAYVAIGDGWWGKRHRVLAFDPDGDTWQLVLDREVATPTRGTPVVSVLPSADRPRLQVRYRSGWGTGIGTTSLAVYERANGALVEVLSAEWEREEIHAGMGPTLQAMHTQLAFAADQASNTVLATTTAKLSFWTGKLGEIPEQVDCEVPMCWRQLTPGSPFELEQPAAARLRPGRTSDFYWRHAASTWIERYGEIAIPLVAGLDRHQAAIFRNVCWLAAESGSTSAQRTSAERLAAALPAPPPR